MLKSIFTQFLNKLSSPTSALRQVSLVVGGTVVAQTLNVVTLPLLSRIYSPADFGVLAVYSSVVAILTELAGLRYHLAIPLPKQTRYAHALVCLSFIIQIAMVSLLTIILFLAGDYLFEKLSLEALIRYKYLLPVGLLTIGGYNIVSQWAIREALFATLGKTKVTQAVSGAFVKLILGIIGVKPLGLIVGTIFGQAGGVGVLLRALLHKRPVSLKKSLMYRAMLRYRAFPIYNTWVGMLNTFGMSLPQLVLSALYDIRFAGIYMMASSLLNVPATFVGNAIGQVFLQKASIARHSGNLPTISLKSYILLLQIGFFPIISLSMIASPLLTLILGSQWAETGYYALALSPWVAYIFSVSHLGNVFNILDMQRQALAFEICYILTRVIAFYLGKILLNSPLLSVFLFALFNCVFLFLKMLYMFRCLAVPCHVVVSGTFRIAAEALILCLAIWFALRTCSILFIAISFTVASAVYIIRTYRQCRTYELI